MKTDQVNSASFARQELLCRQRERMDQVVLALKEGRDYDSNFRVLFELYYHPVKRFFARKGFSAEDCLDLTQETFLGIFRGIKTYRREARFETWLFKVATTTYLKRLRARSTVKRSGREVSLEDVSFAGTPLESPGKQLEGVLHEERQRAIREAVHQLPEQMRKCLTLRLYQDLTYKEIAVVMKLKIDTVKAHLFQARKKLRKKLDGCSFDEIDQ